MPLMTKDGKLRLASEIVSTLKKNRLRKLGFDIPSKVTARQAVMLNRVEEDLPSKSDVAKADDIELQEMYRGCGKKHRESHCVTRGRII